LDFKRDLCDITPVYLSHCSKLYVYTYSFEQCLMRNLKKMSTEATKLNVLLAQCICKLKFYSIYCDVQTCHRDGSAGRDKGVMSNELISCHRATITTDENETVRPQWRCSAPPLLTAQPSYSSRYNSGLDSGCSAQFGCQSERRRFSDVEPKLRRQSSCYWFYILRRGRRQRRRWQAHVARKPWTSEAAESVAATRVARTTATVYWHSTAGRTTTALLAAAESQRQSVRWPVS